MSSGTSIGEAPRPARPWRLRLHPAVTATILTVAALGVVHAASTSKVTTAPVADDAPVPASPTIEARFGVRITRIAVTADGGLIDLRYQIIDGVKAANFGQTRTTAPLLDTHHGVLYTPAMLPHDHVFEPGRTYYLIYRNALGVVHRGGLVDVTVGGLRLGNVPVR